MISSTPKPSTSFCAVFHRENNPVMMGEFFDPNMLKAQHPTSKYRR